MASGTQSLNNPATGIASGLEGFAKIIGNPADEARAQYLGSTVSKNYEDIAKIQRERDAAVALQHYIQSAKGVYDPGTLAGIMSVSPDYLSKLGPTFRTLAVTAPGATPQSQSTAMLGAGDPMASTPQGFAINQAGENTRAGIAAAPQFQRNALEDARHKDEPIPIMDATGKPVGYARRRDLIGMQGVQPYDASVFNAGKKPVEYGPPNGVGPNMQMPQQAYNQQFGNRPMPAPVPASVYEQHARNQQQQDEWNNKPVAVWNSQTNQAAGFVRQADLTTLPPHIQPFEPTVATAMLHPTEYSDDKGTNWLGAYSNVFRGNNAVRAPTPPGVQQQNREPIPAVPPGGTEPVLATKGDVAQGGYKPPPPAVTTPAPTKIDANALFDLDQIAQTMMARSAGRPDTYFTGTHAAPGDGSNLPDEFKAQRQAINDRAAELAATGMEQNLAVKTAMLEKLPNWSMTHNSGWFGWGGPAMQVGAPTGYTGPQVQRDPSGARVQPLGQPKKQAAPQQPQQPQQTAKQDTPAATPRPAGMSDAQILMHARDSIASNPASRPAVIERLRGWRIDPAGL